MELLEITAFWASAFVHLAPCQPLSFVVIIGEKEEGICELPQPRIHDLMYSSCTVDSLGEQ